MPATVHRVVVVAAAAAVAVAVAHIDLEEERRKVRLCIDLHIVPAPGEVAVAAHTVAAVRKEVSVRVGVEVAHLSAATFPELQLLPPGEVEQK